MPNDAEVDDPLSLNLYTYCGSNPILYIDPSGHTATEIAAASATPVLGVPVYGEAAYVVIVGGTACIEYGPVIVNTVGTYGPAVWEVTVNVAEQAKDKVEEGAEIAKEKAGEIVDGAKETAEKATDWIKEKFGGGSSNGKPTQKPSLKIFKNNKEANKMAEKFGYDNTEALKEAFVGKSNISKFNMKYDTKTGEIFLESIKDSSIQVSTGLFK